MKLNKKLEQMLEHMKESLPSTYYHSVRVKRLVYKILKTNNKLFQLSAEEIDAICEGALLHDMGKCYLRNAVLTDEGPITEEEKQHLKQHPQLGYDAIKGYVHEDNADMILSVCLHHHERIDGGGYIGLTDYPNYIEAVAICDVYDALTSDRVYHESIDATHAMNMIKNGKCGTFSPEIIQCLEAIMT